MLRLTGGLATFTKTHLFSMNKPTKEQVRQARIDAGLTQTQAAELVHVQLRAWQRYEDKSDSTCIPLANWELFLIKAADL